MGAYRNLALTELPIRGISVEPTGGDGAVAVVASDSGLIFVNKYVSGDTTYTLPAVADAKGKMFWFFNAQTTKSIVVSAPSNTMFMGDNIVTTSATSAADCGECAMAICDGSSYYFFAIYGTWANASS